MNIIDSLFSLSLALALILLVVIFNVYAADQSICNSGANVVLHNVGSLKSCQLKDDYDANNIRCKNGGSVSFYSDGNLESCVLSAEATIDKNKCKADGQISFFIDGKLKSCMKQDNWKTERMVMIMNQNESDQLWQQLRFYVENIFIQPLANDVQKIEYKPRYIALLEMPSENHQTEL
jgi:hypothetical protein